MADLLGLFAFITLITLLPWCLPVIPLLWLVFRGKLPLALALLFSVGAAAGSRHWLKEALHTRTLPMEGRRVLSVVAIVLMTALLLFGIWLTVG